MPALRGLGASCWDANSRAAIVDLSRGSSVAHIARAAPAGIAFQGAALLQAMCKDGPVQELCVDGGASVNDPSMQFQAELLGIPVLSPRVAETTALGAACLAGRATGVDGSLNELSAPWQSERRFAPQMLREQAAVLMRGWQSAVRQARTV